MGRSISGSALEAVVVGTSQGYSRRLPADIVYRRIADGEVRPDGLRFMLAVASVLAIVTFTLASITYF